jgi:2,5-dioxopentanoate dehydrogenase
MTLRSIDAATGEPFGEEHQVHTVSAVDTACVRAASAALEFRETSADARAKFLEAIGDEILAIGDVLIETAMRESGLPRARLEGERGRTIGQLKLFADVLRKGYWMGLRVDSALPDRTPAPRPDLRMRKIGVGPVAIFGASNFPLAFSTAGGDTASALAAGCPVVVKGHPAHPATGALVAAAIERAVVACDMPAGIFGHIAGPGEELGTALVNHPDIAAVGFTGSRSGGLALQRVAQNRVVPIPVYAEMSSINPVILLPEALRTNGEQLGSAFIASLTMGAGQFCTNPGLIFVIDGEGYDEFLAAASLALSDFGGATMLTPSICKAYADGATRLAAQDGVDVVARGQQPPSRTQGQGNLFVTNAAEYIANGALRDEIFGATSLIVKCLDEAELGQALAATEGQLTATLHLQGNDVEIARRLLPRLEHMAGRILVNGWPTGVEVSHAMVHGGPFPATSDSRTTSVGSMAIDRFLRPVSYQNLPQELLPPSLRDEALTTLPHLRDGTQNDAS